MPRRPKTLAIARVSIPPMSMISSDHGYEPHMQSVGETLEEIVEAAPSVVGPVRARLADLAARAGASPDRVDAVRLAVSEAITNAILHAYPGDPGPIFVSARVREADLTVVIADQGRGVQPQADRPGLGLGLRLITRLSDDCQILPRAEGGTEVRIRFRLARSQVNGIQFQGAGPVTSSLTPGLRRTETSSVAA